MAPQFSPTLLCNWPRTLQISLHTHKIRIWIWHVSINMAQMWSQIDSLGGKKQINQNFIRNRNTQMCWIKIVRIFSPWDQAKDQQTILIHFSPQIYYISFLFWTFDYFILCHKQKMFIFISPNKYTVWILKEFRFRCERWSIRSPMTFLKCFFFSSIVYFLEHIRLVLNS